MDFVGESSAQLVVCSDVDEVALGKLRLHAAECGLSGYVLVVCGDVDESTRNSSASTLDNAAARTVYLSSGRSDGDSEVVSNAHGRDIDIRTGLRLVGFTESEESLKQADVVESDSEDEGGNVAVEVSSAGIKDILLNISDSPCFRVLVLNYVFSHTLNHVLFHMPEELCCTKVRLCLIAAASKESLRLPAKLGGLSLVGVESLRLTGRYAVIDLRRETNEWNIVGHASHCLNDE